MKGDAPTHHILIVIADEPSCLLVVRHSRQGLRIDFVKARRAEVRERSTTTTTDADLIHHSIQPIFRLPVSLTFPKSSLRTGGPPGRVSGATSDTGEKCHVRGERFTRQERRGENPMGHYDPIYGNTSRTRITGVDPFILQYI